MYYETSVFRPYFKHVGPTYILPPELPDIPIGVQLTPVEVEQLPRIYIDVRSKIPIDSRSVLAVGNVMNIESP